MSRSKKSLRAVLVSTALVAVAAIVAAAPWGGWGFLPLGEAAGGATTVSSQPLAPMVLLYDNGGLATGTATESGVSAPAGTQWSEVQHNTGSTTEANTTAGFTCAVTATVFRCADDFTVPPGETWTVDQVVVFAYQTGFAGSTSPITAATLQIWNGRPGDAGATVVFGDETTNRLGTSTDALMYRIFNTAVPPPGSPPGTTRKIWQTNINVAPAAVLTAGTYWIDWNTQIGTTTGHFAPSETVLGFRTVAGWNARQKNGATWGDAIDAGNPASAPDVAQDFPFKINGTSGGGGATPTPTPPPATPTPTPTPPPASPTPSPNPSPSPSCTPTSITEGFDVVVAGNAPIPGWFAQNNSSPLGSTNWFQGNNAVFPSHTGAPNSYIGANFNNTAGTGTISNWLLTPTVTLQNGAQMTFWTRGTGSQFPDRLQVRMSTNGASTNVGAAATDVGDFTTLLLDINPTYTPTGYPAIWTQQTITVTGVGSPTLGRFAFRYFVENGGPTGANSDYIGIDTFAYGVPCGPVPTPSPGVTPTPSPTPPPATPTPTPPPATPTPTPTPPPGCAGQTFPASGLPVAVPDSNPAGVPLTITVSGLTGTLTSAQLRNWTWNPAHSWGGDIKMTLQAPSGGPTATIVERRGNTVCPPTGFGSSNDLVGPYNFGDGFPNTFHTIAGNPVPAGDYSASQCVTTPGEAVSLNTIFGGPVRPAEDRPGLEVFDGMSPEAANGNWTLTVSDNAGGDTGTLSAANLCLVAGGGGPSPTPTPTPPPATPSPTPNPSPSPTCAPGGGFSEGFETGLPNAAPFPNHAPPGAALALASGSWFALNNSAPIGATGVFGQGGVGAPFPPNTGAGLQYAAMNFQNGAGLAALNTFLMSPVVTFNNGDTITFYTRTVNTPAFPDRLHLKMSTSGASTNAADFTITLLTVNSGLTTGGYPNAWTQFTGTVSGLGGPTSGRFAFNYEVPNGGPSGSNSDFIGIDQVVYTGAGVGCPTPTPSPGVTPTPPPPTPTPTPPPGCAGQTFPASGLPLSVPDVSTVSTNIVVSGLTGTLTSAQLRNWTWNPIHTWGGDIKMTLQAPSGGPTATIVERRGNTVCPPTGVGSSNDLVGPYNFGDGFPNTFHTVAGNPVPAGDYSASQCVTTPGEAVSLNTIFGGPVRPAQDDTGLATFEGMSPEAANGTWTLTVTDGAAGDTGTISAVNLCLVTGGGGPSPTPTPTPVPTPAFTIRFVQNTYTEDESQTAVIGIVRNGDLSGTNTVNFATSNGTATGGAAPGAGIDYQTTSTNVTFNPGDTLKTVNVPVFGDTLAEPTETVNLTLTGVGTRLPEVQNAILNINDTASQYRFTGAICTNLGTQADVYPAPVTVAGGPNQIGNLRVTLYDLEHQLPDNLDVLLVGPTGAKFVVMGDAGGNLAIPSNNTVTLSFRDYSAAVLPNAGPLATGQTEPTTWEAPVTNFPGVAPAGPYVEPGPVVGGPVGETFFGSFGFTNSNGVWNLYVRDDGGVPLAPPDVVTGCFNGGWGIEFQPRTAANASISGRVLTSSGQGIRNAEVVLSGGTLTEPMRVQTGSFGYYNFPSLETGQTYILTVNSRRFIFAVPTQVVSLTDNIADLDFIALDTGATNN